MSDTQLDNLELLPEEEILWQGKPNLELAKPKPPLWRQKVVHLFWILLGGGISSASFYYAVNAQDSFLATAIIFVSILIGLVVLFSMPVFILDWRNNYVNRLNEFYAITSRRIILSKRKGKRVVYLFTGSITHISKETNGSVHDLSMYYWSKNEPDPYYNETLHALESVEVPEQLILQNFIREQQKETQ